MIRALGILTRSKTFTLEVILVGWSKKHGKMIAAGANNKRAPHSRRH